MLQQMKKPVALLSAILMCLTMFTGIVLPQIAETATAVADPYAAVAGHVTQLTVTDGKVTPTGGSAMDVPEEYLGLEIYEPDARVLFWDHDWTAENLGITDAEGTYFFARYGDGVEWGNGKVYLLKWRVNAFGKTQYKPLTKIDGTQIDAAGKHSGWSDMINMLHMSKPVIGADNNWYVMAFPANMEKSTGSTGGGNEVIFTTPDLNDTVTSVTELTAADYTTVNFFGPQAGKSPSMGEVGNVTVNNKRGTDTTRETVFSSTFWSPVDAIWKFDGIAQKGTCKLYRNPQTDKNHISGMYMNNVYMELTSAGNPFIVYGSNNQTDLTAAVFHMTNCYYNSNITHNCGSINYIQGNDVLMDNVVINGLENIDTASTSASAPYTGRAGLSLRFLPSFGTAADTAFLGEYRNDYYSQISNCTFNFKKVRKAFEVYNERFATYDSALMVIKDNYVSGFNQYFYDRLRDSASSTGNSTTTLSTEITGNFIQFREDSTEYLNGTTFNMCNGVYSDGEYAIVKNNTIVATQTYGTNDYHVTDVSACNTLLDLSSNLFLDHKGNVRVPRASWCSSKFDSNTKVCTDVYASDEMSGGINELFTVLDAKQNLFVANSYIQTVLPGSCNFQNEYGTEIVGSLTVMAKAGVTYNTKDLFIFNNPNVAYAGVYSDKKCTTPVSSFKTGFDELYVKAEYQAGTTKATAIFKLHEPIEYHIVSLSGATSYTFPFDGVTYTGGETASNGVAAVFHSTFASAANACVADRPIPVNAAGLDVEFQESVIVLTPGTYTVDQGFAYGCPIVGPMLGVSPSDGKTDVVQNGRGVDASKEAVFNAKLTFHPTDNPYIAIGGIASAYTGNLVKINEDKDLARTAHVSIQDFCYIGAANSNLCLLGLNSGKWDCRITLDNVYYKTSGTASPIGEHHGRMCRLTNSSITMTGRTGHWIYQAPSKPDTLSFTPASADLVIENNYIARPAATAYGITQRTSYYNVDATASYAQGFRLIYNNNNVIDTNLVFRLMYTDSDGYFEMCNNRISSPSSIGTNVIDTYKPLNAFDFKTKIEKNVILNRTNPWSFSSFNTATTARNDVPDVNENFYGDLNSKVITVPDNNYINMDTSWYYVNEACTVKSSDIELTKGGFVGVEIVDGFKDYEAVLTATSGRTYGSGNFAAANAEVTGIYSDPACEYALSNVSFDGTDKVVYVRVSKDNYIATWKVTLKLASVWGEKGLAPVDDETYVDLTTEDSYASRDGGNSYPFVFLSSNWTDWAYTDATLTTKSNTIETNLEEGVDGTDWNALSGDTSATADPRELKVGTVFYAKMPTTGIIYKLTYGVTAMNSLHCNTGNFATMVFFPGLYNKKMGYDSTDASYNYREDATGGGWVGLFRGELSACTEFNILGPQAGIPGGNVEVGTGRGSTSYAGTNSVLGEAVFAYATPFYLMNGALGTDDVINIDGIGGGWGFRMSTAAGTGASNMYSNSGTSTINIKNCAFRGLDGGQYFLQFHGCGENIDTNLTNDNGGGTGNARATKHNLIVNFDRTCIELDASGKTYGLAKMSANQIHFNECVLLNKRGTANSSDPYGFYINPVRGDKNATKVDVSYTCENSYLNWQNGYLFGVYLNGTTGLNKNNRNKIEVAFRNNTIVDPAKNTANNSRAAIVSFYSSATSGNNLADAAAITEIEMTGNTVTNTGSGYPTYGYMIYGFDGPNDNFSGYKSVNISKNTFKGYNNMFIYFDDYDLADNIYLDTNGRFMSGRFHATGSLCYTSDIVLAHDYSKHASDFNVKAGIKMNGNLTWAPGALDITGNATRAYTAGMTASDVEGSLVFSSDNIKVVDLFEQDGITPATTLAADTTYRLVLTYKDSPELVSVVYNVYIEPDTATIPVYNGEKVFYDPDVAGMSDGSRVVRALDGVNYQFTVGKNVHASLADFEIITGLTDANGNAACARHVYLFAKEYGTPVGGMSSGANYRHMTTYFYGAKAGVSAVKMSGGIAVDRADDRKDPSQETVFRDASFGCGYQTNAVFDGVMFAGFLNVSDSSPERGSFISEFVVKNCTTHPDAPVYGNGNNWKCFALNYATMMYALKFYNNYFEAKDTGYSGNLIVARNTAEIDVSNSVFRPMSVKTGFLFDSAEDSTGKGKTNASLTSHNLSIVNSTLSGRTYIDSIRTQKALTGDFPVDIKILNNTFDLANQTYAVQLSNYSGSEEIGIVDFDDTSIEISDNTFTGGPETTEAIYVYGKKTAGLDDQEFKAFNIMGNTFITTDEAPIGYAFNNVSDTVIDASRNTFVGFESNYGYRFYEPAAAKELRIVNEDALNLGLTEQNVLFSGISNATFTIDGVDYKANAVANDVTVANAAASGALVADGTTITDVATMDDGKAYAFKPAKGMMVKITDAEGNVYYNAIPVSTDKNNAKTTFTAQLTTIDNTPVGEEFTVTAYGEPIKVNINADDCSVVHDFEAGKATLTWSASFRGKHSTYITDLINKSGFTIVEYGMYYANDEQAISDVAIANGYVDGKYTVGSDILGQKAVYESDMAGLTSVKLDYKHQFTATLPDETEARYGRMYMTYMVGDTTYTVLSDAVTLTMYVAN